MDRFEVMGRGTAEPRPFIVPARDHRALGVIERLGCLLGSI